MYHSDEYVEINAQFLIRLDQTKKIKITCRCGSSQVIRIPGIVYDGSIIPIVPCQNCQQEYVLYNKQFVRIENFKTINGELLPVEVQGHESWKRKSRRKEN